MSQATTPTIAPRYVSPDDAGTYTSLSRPTIDRFLRSGRLACHRIGRRVLIDVRDLDALIRGRDQTPESAA